MVTRHGDHLVAFLTTSFGPRTAAAVALAADSEGDQVIVGFSDYVARDPGDVDGEPPGLPGLVWVKNPVKFLKKFVLVVHDRDRE